LEVEFLFHLQVAEGRAVEMESETEERRNVTEGISEIRHAPPIEMGIKSFSVYLKLVRVF